MSSLEQISSILINDTKISISEAGKGEPILCLHGNPGNKNIFSNLMTKLEGTGIKLIAPDRPGHNLTDELPSDSNNLWEDTKIYTSLINSKLNKKSWILGYDYGCLTALKIAIKNLEMVKGLILINPYIIPEYNDSSISLAPKFAKGFLIGSILGVMLPYNYEDIFEQRIKDTFKPETPKEEYLDVLIQRYSRFESVVAFLNDNNIRINIQDELKEEMKKLSLPAFALFGAKDSINKIQTQQEAISLIPNVKTETLEEAGHNIPYSNADACIEFIKKVIA
ncbi:MAG: alpha/beta hydrolase [Candidatus Riflebacteria bacterium]|nr:alpha/beta hydrolase [Candidatus Riflebacteria bacterium]